MQTYEGNYVISGGDWNMNPPEYNPVNLPLGHHLENSEVKMAPGFIPVDWKWAFDPYTPTNRNNDLPYVKGRNGTTVLDYFVVSPNIQLYTVEVIDLNFKDSDHNPVYLRFSIKPERQ
ncbi:MAG: hypothetical protein Q8O72_15465 [Bacteroidales bacterium]|nr:hypothetical protein [Bacteroidales bacterium]